MIIQACAGKTGKRGCYHWRVSRILAVRLTVLLPAMGSEDVFSIVLNAP
ncbi:MAG: hypothetical protein JW969_04000 [Spirochaetales bacterium]|nr:hypothetical protein [Spirochaetales bacterium]